MGYFDEDPKVALRELTARWEKACDENATLTAQLAEVTLRKNELEITVVGAMADRKDAIARAEKAEAQLAALRAFAVDVLTFEEVDVDGETETPTGLWQCTECSEQATTKAAITHKAPCLLADTDAVAARPATCLPGCQLGMPGVAFGKGGGAITVDAHAQGCTTLALKTKRAAR